MLLADADLDQCFRISNLVEQSSLLAIDSRLYALARHFTLTGRSLVPLDTSEA